MPRGYRGGARYGGSYQGYDEGEHPLAAAIQSALGMGMQVYGMRKDAQAQDAANKRADAAAQLDRERFEYGKSRDRLEDDRRVGAAMADAGKFVMPTSVPGMGGPGGSYSVVQGPTKQQREDARTLEMTGAKAQLEGTIKELFARQAAVGRAQALGIEVTESMNSGQIDQLIKSKEATTKDEAEFSDFKRREDYQEGLFRSRPKEPKEGDTPSFLKPDAVGAAAAKMTQPRYDHLTGVKLSDGMAPNEAADAARYDVGNQRKAAAKVEMEKVDQATRAALKKYPEREAEIRAARTEAVKKILAHFQLEGM